MAGAAVTSIRSRVAPAANPTPTSSTSTTANRRLRLRRSRIATSEYSTNPSSASSVTFASGFTGSTVLTVIRWRAGKYGCVMTALSIVSATLPSGTAGGTGTNGATPGNGPVGWVV